MKLNQLWPVALFSVIFLVASFIIGKEVIDKGRAYDQLMHEHVEVLTFKDRLLNQDEWVMLISGKVISSVEDTVWLEKKKNSEAKLIAAEKNYAAAKEQSLWIIYASIALLLLTILLYAGGKKLFLALGASLLTVSMVYLYIGIYAPLLEIHAYDEDLEIPIVIKFDEMAKWGDEYINKGSDYLESWSSYFGYDIEIPEYHALEFLVDGYQYDHSVVFEGKMYYYFQSKSVDSIIQLLYSDGNQAIASAILAFSVIFPVLKLLISLLLVYWDKARKSKILTAFLSLIGKWSMADIFVAAIFLAFFSFHSMNVGIQTSSETLIGLYFFFGYAIISILASIMIWMATRKENAMKLYESI